jgi:hypothetical protein
MQMHSWNAIEYLIKASENGKIGFTRMGDRKIGKVTKINWILRSFFILKD